MRRRLLRGSADQVFSAVIGLTVIAGATLCAARELLPSAEQQSIRRIIQAIESRHSGSLDLARRHFERFDASPSSLALAAHAAVVCFAHDAAIEYFQQLPTDGGCWEFQKNVGLAKRWDALGKFGAMEKHLRRALEINPWDLEANERLGHLMQVTGRTWEGIPFFLVQTQRGKCRGDELLAAAGAERFFRTDERIQQSGENAVPPEAVVKLGLARRLLGENEHDKAESVLHRVIEENASLGEAQGRLGRIIFERGDALEFLTWKDALGEQAKNHPEVWFVLGLQAQRLGQTDGAVRCFLEALELSPNHLASHIQISRCLERRGDIETAREFARRGESLDALESSLNMLRADIDQAHFRKAINALGELGRYWEAAGWTYVLSHIATDKQQLYAEARQWLHQAGQDTIPNASRRLPAAKLRKLDFAEPNWTAPTPSEPDKSTLPEQVPWRFQNVATEVGIRFNYFEGTTEQTRLHHIFSVVGGGMAAIDYDQDGWSDLHVAQANDWRNNAVQPEHVDRLFRNMLGERFDDVTESSGVGDTGFSHGVTAGDFDQDGFPDLYISNLGPNRLYRNNGDGTFTDVTSSAGVAGNEWSTSSVFADFSGDGLPDLYVTNYSLMEETRSKECKQDNGDAIACTPSVLTAEFHRFYLNEGSGTFRDATVRSGMHLPNGRGLGVVAWDFDGTGRLGLFVANDTCPNFLYINTGNDDNGVPRFQEEGIYRGVAYDLDGNAKASMGVAASDTNADGRLDLYITTFFGEAKTFYSQREDKTFDDLTRPLRLRDSGFWMLGFGCQFTDLDGDGWDDLVITNGHVDQHSYRGDADRMRPQLYRNLQGRGFSEVSSEQLGPFFERNYLGRGLSTLDWNRDGRADFAVSHLHDTFALVSNETASNRRPVVLRLVGRSGTREPVGSVVRARINGRDSFRLYTAGDGYLVTNEHRLVFWVPESQPDIDVQVQWPGGDVEEWNSIAPNQEILLIEQKSKPTVLHRFAAH